MYASPDQYVPQVTNNRRPLITWFVVALASILFALAIVIAPLAITRGSSSVALTIYQAFSHLCHQLPERSFFIGGQKFAVCTRCTGIYFGFAAAALSYPLLRSLRRTDTPARKWLFVAATPLGVDFFLGFFGLVENTHWSRFVTGAILGAAVVFYVLPGLVEVAVRGFKSFLGPPEKGPIRAVNIVTEEKLRTAPSDYSAPERRI
jgi:uncharacterized membrane protein